LDPLKKPRTYDDWLKLSDEQREVVLFSWDPNKREGIGFPYVAAGRLAIASEVPDLDVQVGIYHGGEYVQHAYVSDASLSDPSNGFSRILVSGIADASAGRSV
jgi:hypothetical protein